MNFQDKLVVITGGTRGIGSSLVDSFYKCGAKVVCTGTAEKMNNVRIKRNQKKIIYHQLDLSSKSSINAFTSFITTLGPVDILVNNAGVNKIDSIDSFSDDDLLWINSVNLIGPFLITRSIAKIMKKRKNGRIINISSIFGVVSKKKRAAYSSTKSGLIGFTKAVALDLAPYNILVNSVSPGFVNTELTKKIIGEKNLEELSNSIPISRLAEPEEIAQTVLFLSSNQNTYITGQNIIIDGGFTSA